MPLDLGCLHNRSSFGPRWGSSSVRRSWTRWLHASLPLTARLRIVQRVQWAALSVKPLLSPEPDA
jgi:hypothetical protein